MILTYYCGFSRFCLLSKQIMETIHLYNLNSLCRICLSKTENMSPLFDSCNGLYGILKVIVNIEVGIFFYFILPNYYCFDVV